MTSPRTTFRTSLKKAALGVIAAAALSAAFAAPQASAAFGIEGFNGVLANQDGTSATQAGAHPYVGTTTLEFPSLGPGDPDGQVKDAVIDAPPGVAGNPRALTSDCTSEEFTDVNSLYSCPIGSQVGTAAVTFAGSPFAFNAPLYSLVPSSGEPARFAFRVANLAVYLVPSVRTGDYGLTISSLDISQGGALARIKVSFWGVPADPRHDGERGSCLGPIFPSGELCPLDAPEVPFLTSSTNCAAGPLTTTLHADEWAKPGVFHHSSFTADTNGNPTAVTGCAKVPFDPELGAELSTDQAETPSGLAVHLSVPDAGLLNPDGLSQAHLKSSVVALPEGVTINPSAAEGLGVCTPAQYGSSELTFDPDGRQGCPLSSKLGTVEVHTPVLEEAIQGSVFLAKPYDNPFNSLLAVYIVLANPQRGILVKLPGEIRTNEQTGRIEAEFDDLPQFPFSTFDFHFREGARAPLVSPPRCGTYTTQTTFVPWSAEDPDNPQPSEVIHQSSQFKVTRGVGGGPCPQGGVPPFHPGFSAGSINNNAGSYSPFTMRLTREDGEQDMTRLSSILPPGVLGKLAGVSKCSDQAIAQAKTKTGREELASPSCPANSQIGHILAGAGVGSVLTYVPGKLYLGGPVGGDPLSVVVITPAVAGPFDVGTVVTREALTLNPETAEVEVDGKASDPIPHILAGIPLKLRDLRAYVDRDKFILNPTSCDPSSVKATLFGSYLDVLSPNDDVPVALSDRFQAANCSALGFKPKLSINLKGGTRRGGHPALNAVLDARPGDANIGAATVTLPKSAFLDQAHIKTICTRVQFAAKACPAASIYGHARAFTPLLDEPVEGPVYLRSSNHKLPDLVAALHGLVDVNIVGRIDSFKGGIRSSFETVPDAPVSKFILSMQGGKKGLVVNSRNLCAGKNRASADFVGQNGKPYDFKPVVKASCGQGKRK